MFALLFLCVAVCLLRPRMSEYEAAVHVYINSAEIVFFYDASYDFLQPTGVFAYWNI